MCTSKSCLLVMGAADKLHARQHLNLGSEAIITMLPLCSGYASHLFTCASASLCFEAMHGDIGNTCSQTLCRSDTVSGSIHHHLHHAWPQKSVRAEAWRQQQGAPGLCDLCCIDAVHGPAQGSETGACLWTLTNSMRSNCTAQMYRTTWADSHTNRIL